MDLISKKIIKILVATNHLNKLGGSETFTFSLIEELSKREYIDLEYFTFRKGLVSEKIEKELGVAFMSREKYDLILANHNSCVAKLFTKGFIIQTCHGIFPILEQPSYLADCLVSISEEVQNHLIKRGYKSKIIRNGINCQRFNSEISISSHLKRVLSLCQSESANEIIKNICLRNNLAFYSVNKFLQEEWEMEKIINKADIVIGLGRSAYEAMACGRPVVIYDHRPYSKSFADGYLRDQIEESLKYNCSGRRFQYTFSRKELEIEIMKYDINDGKKLRQFAVANLNMVDKVNDYLDFIQNMSKTLRFKIIVKKKINSITARFEERLKKFRFFNN